jgi:hypothetical protein
LASPFLSVWAPGHGADVLPIGTGIPLPAGSLVIMQVHYNLLVGDRPVTNRLVLHTVPSSTPLLPLQLQIAMAPPNIPCATGVTGKLCNRAASLANLQQRFGTLAVATVDFLESACANNAADPPTGDKATCTWPISNSGYIVRVQPHMHMLGVGFSMVLNPGTAQADTVLSVPNYNFDYQKAYNLSRPVAVTKGERVRITCTYNPQLGQELPLLRKTAPHFVTWGDGSTDEMCIGLIWTASALPDAHATL